MVLLFCDAGGVEGREARLSGGAVHRGCARGALRSVCGSPPRPRAKPSGLLGFGVSRSVCVAADRSAALSRPKS